MPALLRYILLLVVWFLPIHIVMAQAEPARPLKCVTLNLLHGGVLSGRFGDGQKLEQRLQRTEQELARLDADIIGLQEASERNGVGNTAKRLAKRLGMHVVYAPASFRLFESELLNRLIAWVFNFTEGPALLSRFPIVESSTYDVPRCGRFTDPRVLLCALLETPWGRLKACSTHISRNECQSRWVLEKVRQEDESLPLILTGDFNTLENSPAIQAFRNAGFLDTFRIAEPEAPGYTVWQDVFAPRTTARWRVDYIFARLPSSVPLRSLSSQVVLNEPSHDGDGQILWSTDHYGVFTQLDVF